jgi:hypothetical protein
VPDGLKRLNTTEAPGAPDNPTGRSEGGPWCALSDQVALQRLVHWSLCASAEIRAMPQPR